MIIRLKECPILGIHDPKYCYHSKEVNLFEWSINKAHNIVGLGLILSVCITIGSLIKRFV